MKVMAIASPTAAMNPDTLKPHMPAEVPHTLQLYLDGTIDQFWFRERKGPIFLMNVETEDQAHVVLNTLPLVKASLMTYEVMQVGPLMPLGRLIQPQ